jgi:predicted transglutaminase-like cysteine proteinase
MSAYIVRTLLLFLLCGHAAQAATANAHEKAATWSPRGWLQLCVDSPAECAGGTTKAVDIVMTQARWEELWQLNHWVNGSITPETDMDHWGVPERWSVPTDGFGDCEDYAIEKRRLLIAAGWPRQALLMTVVRDKAGAGHAALTVATTGGDFILDDHNDLVGSMAATGYRLVVRQSQRDPNLWVSLN